MPNFTKPTKIEWAGIAFTLLAGALLLAGLFGALRATFGLAWWAGCLLLGGYCFAIAIGCAIRARED